ncbi:hypothetical protein AUP68_01380 [Ilyonectria robusta]
MFAGMHWISGTERGIDGGSRMPCPPHRYTSRGAVDVVEGWIWTRVKIQAKGQNLIRIGWTCAFATAISETSLWVHGLRWVEMSLRLSGRSRIGRPLVLSSLSGCAHALDRLKRPPVATGLSLGPMDDAEDSASQLEASHLQTQPD